MNMNKDALPAEIWYISTLRIRQGRGAQRLVPKSIEYDCQGMQIIKLAGRRGVVWSMDCFATEAEAKQWGLRECRAMQREETRRHDKVRIALNAAEKELK